MVVNTERGDWLEALAGIEDEEELAAFLSGSRPPLPPDASAALHAGVLGALYHDRPRALRLNRAATPSRTRTRLRMAARPSS